MAWWSKLAQVGAMVAAPFTGGTTLALLPAISAAAQMAGNYADQKSAQKKAQQYASAAGQTAATMAGAAGASRDARLQEDTANAGIYRAIVEAEQGKTAAELAQKKYELEAGGKRVGNVARADLLRGATKFSMGGPGQGEGAARMAGWQNQGGIDPSLFTADSKRAADLLVARDLAALEKGEGLTPMTLPKAPELSKAGTMEKVMGIGGLVGGLAQPWLDVLMQSKMPTVDAGTTNSLGYKTAAPMPIAPGFTLPKATFLDPLPSKPISGFMSLPKGR